MISDAQALIRDYIDHLQDKAYVRSIFDLVGSNGIATTLEAMIREGSRDDVAAATLFLRDAMLFRFAPKMFCQSYPHSALLSAIRERLYARDYYIRHQQIHTLGKIGPRGNAHHLLAALPWYLAHDPLNLDGLLFELGWLRPRVQWPALRKRLVRSLVIAPLFVTRWAAVEILWTRELGSGVSPRWRGASWVRQFLRRLAQDQHPWVRAEAKWRLDQLRRRRALERFNEWRHDSHGPRRPASTIPSYFEVSLNVGNYLSISGEVDYSVDLVETIALYLVNHPITPGYDLQTYWSAMISSRGANPDE